MGSSGGLSALWFFYWCARERRTPFSGLQLDSTELLFATALLRELIGSAIYLRYGYVGQGLLSVKLSHISHLGGCAAGAAWFYLRRSWKKIREDADIDAHVDEPALSKHTDHVSNLGNTDVQHIHQQTGT